MRAAIGVVVALVWWTGVASADPVDDAKAIAAQAKQAAIDGNAAGNDRGKLEEAIALYKQAYGVDPNPLYRCNAGVAYMLIDELPRAHALLTQCLQRLSAVQPTAVAQFRTHLDQIELALPGRAVPVDVVSDPAGATLTVSAFAEDEPVVAPTVVWLPAGTHTIRGVLAGHEDASSSITIDLADPAKQRVRLELAAVVIAPEVRDRVVVQDPPGNGKRTAGWISVIGGAVLLAGGGAMHAITSRTREDLAGLSGDAYDDELPTFQTQRAVTLGLYGVGAAAAITGAVLLYLSSHQERVAITPADGGGAMVWIDLTP